MIATPTANPAAERNGGRADQGSAPHLSHSRIARYLTCPEQYRLHYLERLRPRLVSASLVFGANVHLALHRHFANGEDPVAVFAALWKETADRPLAYRFRESRETLGERGEALLAKFMAEERPRIGEVRATEKGFELSVTGLGLPFVGIVDLLADVDGERTVVDWKTSGASYEAHEAEMSDQLTAYALAEPDAARTAFCVFVKTKEPKIEWQFAKRTGDRMVEFLAKAAYVGGEIEARSFHKRPGKHCSWCDFLPVCLGDRARIEATLVRGAE